MKPYIVYTAIMSFALLLAGCAGSGFSMWDGSPGPQLIQKTNSEKARVTALFSKRVDAAKAEELSPEDRKAFQESLAKYSDLLSGMAVDLTRQGYVPLAKTAIATTNRFKLRGAAVEKHAAVLDFISQTVTEQHRLFFVHDNSVDGSFQKRASAYDFNTQTELITEYVKIAAGLIK